MFDLKLMEEPDYCVEMKDSFNIIGEQVSYLMETINDFRSFLSPSTVPQETSLNQIIDKSLKIINKSLEIDGIKVIKNYNFNKIIRTFPNEIIQVLINIFRNSMDTYKSNEIKDPVITINGKETESFMEFEIIDNAGGIKPSIIDRIFEQYATTKSEKTASGLGLYMSKIIIDKHCQGKLTASNKNQGACFTIKLPLTIKLDKETSK
ncbi:MAG: HAMP domain-containing histidine kinase [Flavobacteriaceae bacterium]|nr:HAMP domain-containing histidine kinase [Flavobacteriaceae bacterium]